MLGFIIVFDKQCEMMIRSIKYKKIALQNDTITIYARINNYKSINYLLFHKLINLAAYSFIFRKMFRLFDYL